MNLGERWHAIRTGFNRSFWVANTLELFERLAFYGSKAVLTVYLAEKVGLGTTTGNTLVGLYGFAVFFLPILAGTVVDRYGFRKSLAACFFIFSLGYFAVGLAGMAQGQGLVGLFGPRNYVIGALLLTAIGGSLIKPCIVGTVARTTTPETKSLGYSVYYTLVNFGGFIGPLLALPVRESLGIEYVLVMASLVSLLNFIGTLVFFKEPTGGTPPSEAPRTFGKVFADMVLVFGNVRFISFLVIFSGFWVMFWQIFYTLPFYVKDVLHFEKFEILETVDALGIILFSVPITAAMSKVRPILAMSLGFTVASGAWLLMAASPTVAATVAAMILFAMGEAMQAPRFYEYVSDLAPREQVGTFMGFAFLPVAIGALLAGRLSGYLVQHYIKDLQQPAGMWVLLSVLGFVTTGLMLAYDRLVAGRKTA